MMLKCPACGAYTMKKTCPACDGKTASPHPARYSPSDRYGKYRREMKKQMRA